MATVVLASPAQLHPRLHRDTLRQQRTRQLLHSAALLPHAVDLRRSRELRTSTDTPLACPVAHSLTPSMATTTSPKPRKPDPGDLPYNPSTDSDDSDPTLQVPANNENDSSMRKRARVSISKSINTTTSPVAALPPAPAPAQASAPPPPPTSPSPAKPRSRRSRFVEGSMRDRASTHPPHELFIHLPESAMRASSDTNVSSAVSTRGSTTSATSSQKKGFGFGLGNVFKFSPLALVGEVRSAWQRQKTAHEARERRKQEFEEQYKRMKAAGEFKPSFPTPETYAARAAGAMPLPPLPPPPPPGLRTPERMSGARVTPSPGMSGSARKRRWDGQELMPPQSPGAREEEEDEDMPDAGTGGSDDADGSPVDMDDIANTTFARQLRELDNSGSNTPTTTANTSLHSLGNTSGKPLSKRELKKQERLAKKISDLEEQLAKARRELEASVIIGSGGGGGGGISAMLPQLPDHTAGFANVMAPPPLPRKESSRKNKEKLPRASEDSFRSMLSSKSAISSSSSSKIKDSSKPPTPKRSSFFSPRRNRTKSPSRSKSQDRQRKTKSSIVASAATMQSVEVQVKQHRYTQSLYDPGAVELEAPLTEESLVSTDRFVAMLPREMTKPHLSSRPEEKKEKEKEMEEKQAAEERNEKNASSRRSTDSHRKSGDEIGDTIRVAASSSTSSTSPPPPKFPPRSSSYLAASDPNANILNVPDFPQSLPLAPPPPPRSPPLPTTVSATPRKSSSLSDHNKNNININNTNDDEDEDTTTDENFSMVALSPVLNSSGLGHKGGMLGAAVSNAAARRRGGEPGGVPPPRTLKVGRGRKRGTPPSSPRVEDRQLE